MPAKPSITIIGAGISGLTLGRTLLQNHGIKATILEKARKSTNRNNYGITLYASGYRPLLKILKVDEQTFKKRVAVDAGIGGTGKLIKNSGDYDESFRVNRSRLEEMIGEGLDVRWESEVEDVKAEGEKSVVVTVKDREKLESEIVVGADGPHSKVRETIAPEVEFKILPFAVYNGRRIVRHEDWEAKRINALLEGKVLEQRIGSAVFQVSLNDCTKEELNVSYTYSRPARTKGEDELFRPERPKNAAREMPEALFLETGNLREQLEEPFKTVFDPAAMRKDRLLNWLLRTARVDWEKLNEAADQGVVLLGDSVHPEPILGGMGANEAIEDAIQLAAALSKGSRDSMKQYVDERYPVWEEGLSVSEVSIEDMHSKQRASL
ncbi:FAD-dependent monooxygenase vrtH [Pseudocercospora fuligena]|uniref:FAD-dependent monooxygenase vrtH n=1 Tax=Pseudocercospora fuligena TaxID=685502 RepID=A0A8H6RED6_9PEZI|nr:FAD-dependent monooxygenase vrtH [Pseudocercospora fuligena]